MMIIIKPFVQTQWQKDMVLEYNSYRYRSWPELVSGIELQNRYK